jgi:hypothetical protein
LAQLKQREKGNEFVKEFESPLSRHSGKSRNPAFLEIIKPPDSGFHRSDGFSPSHQQCWPHFLKVQKEKRNEKGNPQENNFPPCGSSFGCFGHRAALVL